MGNKDGVAEAMASQGSNTKCHIDKNNFFSFAFGNEIALVLKEGYYILNCDIELWEKTKKKVKELKTLDKLKGWWYEQSKQHEVSDWSGDFDNLKGC